MRKLLLPAGLAALVALIVHARLHSGPASEAGTAVRMDLEELFDGAALVVEGRLLRADSLRAADGLIVTEYELSLARSFWGDPPARLVFRLPGGVLPDGRGLILPGVPRLDPGEDVLLFLTGAGRWRQRMPVGLAQGAFRLGLDGSGRRVAARRGTRYAVLDPASGSLRCVDHPELWSYAEVSARLQAAASARLARGEREER